MQQQLLERRDLFAITSSCLNACAPNAGGKGFTIRFSLERRGDRLMDSGGLGTKGFHRYGTAFKRIMDGLVFQDVELVFIGIVLKRKKLMRVLLVVHRTGIMQFLDGWILFGFGSFRFFKETERSPHQLL